MSVHSESVLAVCSFCSISSHGKCTISLYEVLVYNPGLAFCDYLLNIAPTCRRELLSIFDLYEVLAGVYTFFFSSSVVTLNTQEVSLSTGSHIASCIWEILTVSVGCSQKYCQLLEVFSTEQCCSFTDFLSVLLLLPLTVLFLCISSMLQKLSHCQTSRKLLHCQNHRNTELIGLERTSGDPTPV